MVSIEFFKELIIEGQSINVPFVERDIKEVKINKIFSIIGPRRSGKTYLMFQFMSNIKKQNIVYINFEDERLSDIKKEDLQKIIDAYFELYPSSKNVYLFFDEIQNVPSWQKFIRRLYDSGKFKIFITGSSAKLLSKEIATELRGRSWEYFVYPFSFKEFLKEKNVSQDVYRNKYEIKKFFKRYIEWGGFPETTGKTNFVKRILLQKYIDLVMLRDVIERYDVKDVHIVKEMVHYLINNFSREFSVNKFYKFLKSTGISVTKDRLYSLMDMLIDTLYFYQIPIHTHSKRKEILTPKKVYLVDVGIAKAFLPSEKKDIGWLYENLTFLKLIRDGYSLKYFKGENECDFVIEGDKNFAVQVTLDKNKGRELNGLVEAMKQLKLKEGMLITENEEDEIKIEKKSIRVVPLWKFLLE